MENSLLISYKKHFITDIAFVVFIIIVPTISHLVSFPLYMLDPMRLSVLGSYLLLRNRNNSLFLAMTLPLVSFLLSGHPVAFKNMIIAIELAVNVIIIDALLKTKLKTFYAALLSIIFSKIIYYFLKALIIYWGVLQASVIDTNMLIQIGVALVLSVLYARFYERDYDVVR